MEASYNDKHLIAALFCKNSNVYSMFAQQQIKFTALWHISIPMFSTRDHTMKIKKERQLYASRQWSTTHSIALII